MLDWLRERLAGPQFRRIMLVKATVTTGVLAAYALPPEQAVWVAISANLLWIWGDL